MKDRIRLGVNIDHVATLRNARGGTDPDPFAMMDALVKGGADSITIHLREDRRHIRDDDAEKLIARSPLPINLEIAAEAQMMDIACRMKPKYACLVPEKRQELTTEGGLDVGAIESSLSAWIPRLGKAGIRPSLFLDPDLTMIEAACRVQAPAIELHTGRYCNAGDAPSRQAEYDRLQAAARLCHERGIECHAGHGLDRESAAVIAGIQEICELNIGHAIIARALLVGLQAAVREMRQAMDRQAPDGQAPDSQVTDSQATDKKGEG